MTSDPEVFDQLPAVVSAALEQTGLALRDGEAADGWRTGGRRDERLRLFRNPHWKLCK